MELQIVARIDEGCTIEYLNAIAAIVASSRTGGGWR